MRIGIDIDDTVSMTNELLIEKALIYDKGHLSSLGFKDSNAYYFTDMFYWTESDAKNYITYFSANYSKDTKPIANAKSVINKLYDLGYYMVR